MATHNPSNWISTTYLNRTLRQSAQDAFDAVSASSIPFHHVSWMDLYAIFRNSRQLMKDADGLDLFNDSELKALIRIMRQDHAYLRRLLFLVAIENLFSLGSQNTTTVLYIYGEQFEIVEQMSERLTEIEETVQIQDLVKAHLLAAL